MESDQSFRRIIIFRSKVTFWFVNSLLWVYYIFYLQLASFLKAKQEKLNFYYVSCRHPVYKDTLKHKTASITGTEQTVLKCIIFLSPTLTRVKLKLATVTSGFSGGSDVKNLPAMQETGVRFPSWEHPLEEGVATHSSSLAWRIPWTEEPAGLQSMGVAEEDTTEGLSPVVASPLWSKLRRYSANWITFVRKVTVFSTHTLVKTNCNGTDEVLFFGRNTRWPPATEVMKDSALVQLTESEWCSPAPVQTICTPVEEKIKSDSGTESGGLRWFVLSL